MSSDYHNRLMVLLRTRGHNTKVLNEQEPGEHRCPIAYCDWQTPLLDDTDALDAIARHLDRTHPLPHQGEGEFASPKRT